MEDKEVILEEVIAETGKKNKHDEVFTEEVLRAAVELDDDLVFDEKTGQLKLVLRRVDKK